MIQSGFAPKTILAGALSLLACGDDAGSTSGGTTSSSSVTTTTGGSSSSSSSTGGQGGQGPMCETPADCTLTTTACTEKACEGGMCLLAPKPAGTPAVNDEIPGDCQAAVCDGQGTVVTEDDDLDLPDDQNDCTVDGCEQGTPAFEPEMAGAACATNGGTTCDGMGQCIVPGPPTCMDGIPNGMETGIDCGGPTCGPCADGQSCMVDGDCQSAGCIQSVCGPVNGCSLPTAEDHTGQSAVNVTFANISYTPKCIVVSLGTQVTFQGTFSTHPLLGGYVAGGLFPAVSGPFVPVTDTGTSATFTMAAAGTFPYYCTAHALIGMTGAVFVVP